MDDDYFAGSKHGRGSTGSSPSPTPPNSPSTVPSPTSPSRQSFTIIDYRILAGFAALGVIGTLVWWIAGRPHTNAPHWAFEAGLCFAALIALTAPPDLRRHRFGILSAGVFIGGGTLTASAALVALATGSAHAGRNLTHLAIGILVVTFFGGGALLGQHNLRNEQRLPPELESTALALIPPGRRYAQVRLLLDDGREVTCVITDSGRLARAPKGMNAMSIRGVLSK